MSSWDQGKEYRLRFGKDTFKWLGFFIQALRLFMGSFGDDDDKKEVAESKERSASSDGDEVA